MFWLFKLKKNPCFSRFLFIYPKISIFLKINFYKIKSFFFVEIHSVDDFLSTTSLLQFSVFLLLTLKSCLFPFSLSHRIQPNKLQELTSTFVWERLRMISWIFAEKVFPRLVFVLSSPYVFTLLQCLKCVRKWRRSHCSGQWESIRQNTALHQLFSAVCVQMNKTACLAAA